MKSEYTPLVAASQFLLATAFIGILGYATFCDRSPKVEARRDGDHIMFETRDYVIYLPIKEEIPGLFIKHPDLSIQFVPIKTK